MTHAKSCRPCCTVVLAVIVILSKWTITITAKTTVQHRRSRTSRVAAMCGKIWRA